MKGGKARGWLPQMVLTMARSRLLRPMVTMMTEMMGSPMSGRSTRRSTTTPRAMETSRVSTSASGHTSPNWAIMA